MRFQERVRGFTVRELLVVVALIGLALSVVLPAINSPRGGDGRRAICQNNMRQLALAAYSFDANRQLLPGYRDVVTTPDGQRLSRPLIYMLLPQLERMDLYEKYNAENHPYDGLPDIRLSFVLCPSAGVPKGPRETAASSFIFNTGMPDEPSADAPPDWQANGVFADVYRSAQDRQAAGYTGLSYVRLYDGDSNTLAFSERTAFTHWNDIAEHDVGFVWHPQLEPGGAQAVESPAIAIDLTPFGSARPSSNHPGVFNVAFCDGHVRTLSSNIDYRVYAQLMTPRGDDAAYPGLRDGKKVSIDQGFRTHKLPAELE